MRAIDINAMIGPWSFGELSHQDAGGLLAEMKRLDIERALVFHSQAWRHNPEAGNRILAAEIGAHASLIGVAVLSPLIQIEHGGALALERFMRDHRIGAIRLYPVDHSYTLEPWNMGELMDFAQQHAIPVLLDMRECDGELGDRYGGIHNLAKAYAQVPIVLLTVGYRHLRILLKLLDACPNISLDTSTFITFRGIEEVVAHFGSARVLFGSRTPFIEAGVGIGRILYADLSEGDRQNIAHGNAERLLKGNKMLRQGACER